MRRPLAGSFAVGALLAAATLTAGCPTDDDVPPLDDDDDDAPAYAVPLAPDSPWPKFRRDARQRGQAAVSAADAQGEPWSVPTGKGIFSTPVVGGDGTIYVGSADRRMYALGPDGSERWAYETGEIIDSSALLDDQGRLYFGSGDGVFRALDAASGDLLWAFEADDPAVNDAFIHWFEGNVAIGPDGTLVVPNDNWFVYGLDRDSGEVAWRFTTPDQTWSLAAIDPGSGEIFFGNNNLLELLGDNLFQLDADGTPGWSAFHAGTIAASPLLGADDALFVGGFDGYLRAHDAASGALLWEFGARDHLYASPALLPDGTLIQAGADGTIYALDPADGAVVWAYDTREPIRSSPAVDADGLIYLGSGEGRLYVLNPDGTLRWAMQLIPDGRNDLNGSPALGRSAVYIAGESGEVFGVPFDWCLGDGAADARCIAGPDEDLPDDGAFLLYTTPFGAAQDEPPVTVAANAALAFSLFVRDGGDTALAHLDSGSIAVSVDPPADVQVTVSGDRRFLTVTPVTRFDGGDDGQLTLRITGDYLVNPDREGLAFSGGEVGGSFDETVALALDEGVAAPLPLRFPAEPGDDAGIWQLSRLAAPLPAILPSYNQIGFDSLHYLVGLVEGDGERGVAWVVGAAPADGSDTIVADPATATVFPLQVRYDADGALTLASASGLPLEVMNLTLSFSSFRVSGMLDEAGASARTARVQATTVCSDITFYGPFLQTLGFCNPQTDVMVAYGTALLDPHEGGTQQAPTGLGEVTIEMDGTDVVATLSGSTLSPNEHRVAILVVDATTGAPVNADYGAWTSWTTDGDGHLATVSLDLGSLDGNWSLRAYLMVDTYPAARAALVLD